MRDLTELNRLEEYLKTNRIPYERVDQDDEFLDPEHVYCKGKSECHQLIVYNERGKRLWDAICHRGSYGAEAGLLEVMGDIVDEKTIGDTVEGWLTAEDIIRRIDKKE